MTHRRIVHIARIAVCQVTFGRSQVNYKPELRLKWVPICIVIPPSYLNFLLSFPGLTRPPILFPALQHEAGSAFSNSDCRLGHKAVEELL